MKFATLLRGGIAVLAAAGSLTLTGCGSLSPVKIGGDIALDFTAAKTIPFLLKDSDIDMACASAETLTPVLRSLEVLGSDPDQHATLMFVTAGYCAEQKSFENELRYIRASRANLIEEAQDARIQQKRLAELASRRQYAAWQAMERYYKKRFNVVIGERCPTLKKEFDQMVFMLGMMGGMMSIVNDINSQNMVGVPKDIGAKVERGMACLPNDKWWGVPNGVRAAIWNMLPGSGPAGKDPWDEMVKATKVGDAKGVRLTHALYAVSAQAKGDEAKLRDAIQGYAKSSENFVMEPKYAMFDRMATVMIQNLSDRYWTENTGARTPIGSLGKFWDEKADTGKAVDIDDLL